jgi:hypothetical protein
VSREGSYLRTFPGPLTANPCFRRQSKLGRYLEAHTGPRCPSEQLVVTRGAEQRSGTPIQFPSYTPSGVACSSGGFKPPFTQQPAIGEFCKSHHYASARIDYLERYRSSGLLKHEFVIIHGIHPDEKLGEFWIRVDRGVVLERVSKILALFSVDIDAADTVSHVIIVLRCIHVNVLARIVDSNLA